MATQIKKEEKNVWIRHELIRHGWIKRIRKGWIRHGFIRNGWIRHEFIKEET